LVKDEVKDDSERQGVEALCGRARAAVIARGSVERDTAVMRKPFIRGLCLVIVPFRSKRPIKRLEMGCKQLPQTAK
jgi:hypothetical protein